MPYSMITLSGIHGGECPSYSEATASMALTPWATPSTPTQTTVSPPDDEGLEVMAILGQVADPLEGIEMVVDPDD